NLTMRTNELRSLSAILFYQGDEYHPPSFPSSEPITQTAAPSRPEDPVTGTCRIRNPLKALAKTSLVISTRRAHGSYAVSADDQRFCGARLTEFSGLIGIVNSSYSH